MLFILFHISGFRRLKKPLLDVKITRSSPYLSRVSRVAALPGGEAVVYHYISDKKTRQVSKMEEKVTEVIYSCVGCPFVGALLVLGDYLYVINVNGKVLETHVSEGHGLKVSTIPGVEGVINTGSLYSKPERIPDKQTLLLCDYDKGEVFTFKPSTGHKQVRITGLSRPRSVSYLFYNHTVYYVVCEEGRSRIIVYNRTWNLMRTMGSKGSKDGELGFPQSALVSDEDTVIISDWVNHRVSEYSFNGTFLRHLLVRSDGIYWPRSMSYYYPHLWLVHGPYDKLYKYNMYR